MLQYYICIIFLPPFSRYYRIVVLLYKYFVTKRSIGSFTGSINIGSLCVSFNEAYYIGSFDIILFEKQNEKIKLTNIMKLIVLNLYLLDTNTLIITSFLSL